MQGTLINNLYQYILENNPDVLRALENSGSVLQYLSDKVSTVEVLLEQLTNENKPGSVTEALCMEFLTKELKPSRYTYILNILKNEFDSKYHQLNKSGLLVSEVGNLVKYCEPVFNTLNFSEENKENKFLQYAISGIMIRYFNSAKTGTENPRHQLQLVI